MVTGTRSLTPMRNDEPSEDLSNRPFLCTRCGFRTYNWPNVHECSGVWPETTEEFAVKEEREISTDPRMKEHIKRMAKNIQ